MTTGFYRMNLDNVVGTATRLMVGETGVRIPVGVRYFLQNIHTCSGSKMLLTEWVTESFPGDKAAREAKLSSHINLVQRLGIRGAI